MLFPTKCRDGNRRWREKGSFELRMIFRVLNDSKRKRRSRTPVKEQTLIAPPHLMVLTSSFRLTPETGWPLSLAFLKRISRTRPSKKGARRHLC